jgi:5-methylcytosine-specific restriction endonuclease McrA
MDWVNTARAKRLIAKGRVEITEGELCYTDKWLKKLSRWELKQITPRIEAKRQIGNSTRSARKTRALPLTRSPEEIHWRESVLLRDGYTCVFCDSANNLEADHIKPKALYPDLKYDIANGRTLCHNCHVKTETYGSKVHRIADISIDS